MLLGFISLLLTVSQRMISKICIPTHLANYMLPCKRKETATSTTEHFNFNFWRHLLSEDLGTQVCASKGKVPLVSIEGLHQLHIFIFVLAVVHVIFCATTMVLGVAKVIFYSLLPYIPSVVFFLHNMLSIRVDKWVEALGGVDQERWTNQK